VKTAQEYRRYARECLELANTFDKARAKYTLLHMAQVWLRLAQDAEVQEKVGLRE
jgi:hypothetical protein